MIDYCIYYISKYTIQTQIKKLTGIVQEPEKDIKKHFQRHHHKIFKVNSDGKMSNTQQVALVLTSTSKFAIIILHSAKAQKVTTEQSLKLNYVHL